MLTGWAGVQARPPDHPGLGQGWSLLEGKQPCFLGGAFPRRPSLASRAQPGQLQPCHHSWEWAVSAASQGSTRGLTGRSEGAFLCCQAVGHHCSVDTISRDPMLSIPVTIHLQVPFSTPKNKRSKWPSRHLHGPLFGLYVMTRVLGAEPVCDAPDFSSPPPAGIRAVDQMNASLSSRSPLRHLQVAGETALGVSSGGPRKGSGAPVGKVENR